MEFFKLCHLKSLNKFQIDRLLQLAVDPEVDVTKKFEATTNTPLLMLCCYNNSESLLPVLKQLLNFQEVSAQLNLTNKYGLNAISFLCLYSSNKATIDCVRLLVNLGIDVNAKVKSSKDTSAIELLCDRYEGGNLVDIARLMLYNKCDLDDASRAVDFLKNRNLRRDADVLLKIIESLRQSSGKRVHSKMKPTESCIYLFILLLILFFCLFCNRKKMKCCVFVGCPR